MPYTILYHHLVIDEDVQDINRDILERIKKAVETRLTVSPEQYGSPLRKTLKGYWKLRVGDYRIVYQVIKDEIHILAIAHRSKIYEIALLRKKE